MQYVFHCDNGGQDKCQGQNICFRKISKEDSAVVLVKYDDCLARVKVVSTDIFEKY